MHMEIYTSNRTYILFLNIWTHRILYIFDQKENPEFSKKQTYVDHIVWSKCNKIITWTRIIFFKISQPFKKKKEIFFWVKYEIKNITAKYLQNYDYKHTTYSNL